jgi:excinuclease ABC subunit A
MNAPERIRQIVVTGASEHNLKHVSVTLPRGAITVVTGLSGSGKSSLAFDTIYAEGQRRYVESLSSYARQFLDQMHKPHVEHIEGLSPAISIEQKTVSKNPRSTVGTVTEIYDYLRVLYANIGLPHCPECGHPLEKQTVQQIVDQVMAWPTGTKLLVMAPVVRGRKGEYKQIFEQAQREGFLRVKVDGETRDLGDPIKLNKKLKHDISIIVDRLVVNDKIRQRLTDSVETSLKKAEGLVTIERLPRDDEHHGEEVTFSESMACPTHGPQLVELSPRMFSFNSPFGACPDCNGLGTLQEVDPRRIVPNPELSIGEGAVTPWAGYFKPGHAIASLEEASGDSWGLQWIMCVLEHFKVDPAKPWKKLSETQRHALLYGSGKEKIHIKYASSKGTKFETRSVFEGIIPRIERRLKETSSEEIQDVLRAYYSDRPCPACQGKRLKPESLAVTIKERDISQFCAYSVKDAIELLRNARWSPRETAIGGQALKEIRDRLEFMANVGLDYLTLDRAAATLSGGEGQRIRLATQIGSQLVGVLYILDEPSIGLHHRDNERLLAMLEKLRDLGNTLVVVEHDETTIRRADYVIDLGPGAGRLGGEVVAAGTPAEIQANPRSLTGDYLAGRRSIAVPGERRRPEPGRVIRVAGATQHNLKDVTAEFPLGSLICVTGVSGSGKSTLVNDILYRALAQHFYSASETPGAHRAIEGLEHLDKIIAVDQSPIGRTPRSNPATYTQLFTHIRDLFAHLPEARVRGYKPGRFSFNVKGGRCEACKGDGMIKIEMHFLPDVYVECEACGGKRFNRETLEILYKGKSIADVLAMPAEEALEFFDAVPALRQRLQTINDVGLGYIHLGQSATTLSGGEAQRMKLSRELGKRATGRTMYILDEPTTGLHFEDVRKLIEVLQRLVDEGNTVVVIEHNLDVIKSADWVIDLGPEGGDTGGYIIAEGPPEAVASVAASHTGRALAEVFGLMPTAAASVSGNGQTGDKSNGRKKAIKKL